MKFIMKRWNMSSETMLKNGTVINSTIKIIDFIGAGGQGEVYKVVFHDQHLALKWYFPQSSNNDLKKSLNKLISKGSPDVNFLWPLALVEHGNQFGYLMELRSKDYRSLSDWVRLEFDMSLSATSKACFKLTDAFHKLHAKGLSYKDISFGNLFINPESGNILICDNDNVTANRMNVTNLLGTPKFMAPEIVMGGTIPSTETDQFSLAILLFYILVIAHPFEGAQEANISCFDLAASKKIYGTDAVYIYDDKNDSNRPILGIHNNAINLWKLYPSYLKSLFATTFTVGVKTPSKRTRESQWRKAFHRMNNSLMKCSHCGMENFYDVEVLNTKGKLDSCILCQKELVMPPRMRINNTIIVLDDGKELYENHMNTFDFSNLTVVGRIKKVDSQFLLTNVSNKIWRYVTTSNSRDIMPQQTLILENNSVLEFGKVKGEIRF